MKHPLDLIKGFRNLRVHSFQSYADLVSYGQKLVMTYCPILDLNTQTVNLYLLCSNGRVSSDFDRNKTIRRKVDKYKWRQRINSYHRAYYGL